jgi:FAD:protein FMN transferase
MRLTRRHFIVSAAAASAVGGVAAFIATGDETPGFVWRGSALGGEAQVSLYGADEEAARRALDAVALEIARLETIFSLHQETSELSLLNRDQVLSSPSRDLRELLRSALDWRLKTEGAFDPTVQRLWEAAAAGRDPSRELIKTAGTEITLAENSVGIEQGSALTLNGIAQGRIADRVTEILVNHGFVDVVVDAGELRLPGRKRRAVGIPAAKAAVSVAEVAIATSEPKSLLFDPKGRRHHLIDPRTGESPRYWQSISVFAADAQTADALSTAFAVLPFEAVADLALTIGDISVIGRDRKGRIRRFGNLKSTG